MSVKLHGGHLVLCLFCRITSPISFIQPVGHFEKNQLNNLMSFSLWIMNSCDDFFFFFDGSRVWTQGLTLGRQVLCDMNNASSPFCFSYFSYRLPCFYLGQVFDPNPRTYASCVAGITGACYHVGFWLIPGLANFLPELALNCHPPNLHLSSSWNYRHEPLHPTLWLIFYSHIFPRDLSGLPFQFWPS
jgi:hypothetical protein